MNRSILVTAVALAVLAPAVSAQQQYGRDRDTWRWDGRVEGGRWMNIFNVNGSVRVLPSSDNMCTSWRRRPSTDGAGTTSITRSCR